MEKIPKYCKQMIVVRLDDFKKEFPIRITDIIINPDEILYKGKFAQSQGKIVTRTFKETEIKLSTDEH
jgi:hypothetical protein